MRKHPLLYQLNTRVYLTELSESMGRVVTLDDIPDSKLDELAKNGFDWLWLLSVWQTGESSRNISRTNPEWRSEFERTIPDLKESDIGGSGFAIIDYHVHKDIGGDEALARLRERLRKRKIKLMLDFVPNHMGLDHVWIEKHPDYFVDGSEADLAREPQNYIRITTTSGERIFAYGRDPYFSGWPDTLQLNYANATTQDALIGELLRISQQCDGLRCDMAMLVLPEIFERTWGRKSNPFWPVATEQVRKKVPDFCFMAEVYWDMEWTLQQQGFDFTYDKRLYDRLREGNANAVRGHLGADLEYQSKSARFLENHDEPRSAACFSLEMHRAAAVITFLSPGMRFFHQGQFEGRQKRISPHLVRGPKEPINESISEFYSALLPILSKAVVHEGEWQLLETLPAWDGNESFNKIISFVWSGGDEQVLVAVNYSPEWSQCYVRIPMKDISDSDWRFQDLLGDASYDRDGQDCATRGLYLDVPPWQTHLFTMSKLKTKATC